MLKTNRIPHNNGKICVDCLCQTLPTSLLWGISRSSARVADSLLVPGRPTSGDFGGDSDCNRGDLLGTGHLNDGSNWFGD